MNADCALPEAALDDTSREFIAEVMALRPRVCAFDCDGTLWSGDSGADFFYWEMEQGLLPAEVVKWIKPRYQDYKRGEVDEAVMCGEMVTIHAGIGENLLREAAEAFFAAVVAPRIFAEMRQLVSELRASGVQIWAVSSTNNWVVEAGVGRFGLAPDCVLAACAAIEGGICTGTLRAVPSGHGKEAALRRRLQAAPDAAFGNSVHDREMLAHARHAFAVNPNPDLTGLARAQGWRIYLPQALRQ